MARVFLAWFFSILIGSTIFGLISILDSKSFEIAPAVALISLILSALSSLPLLIVELIAANIALKKSHDFKSYSVAKYLTASLTAFLFILFTVSQENEDTIFRLGGILIAVCYGVPGFILHVKYVKPVFEKEAGKNIINDDLLDN